MKNEIALIKITPVIAQEWLQDIWEGQRHLRVSHVDRLAADMNRGKFHVGPDAILRIKGKLANGQHRLHAIVKSGKAQTFIVLDSNDDELYKVIDAGAKRTTSDALIGLPYSKNIPAVLRWVLAYDRDAVSVVRDGPQVKQIGAVEMIDYCLEHYEIASEAISFNNTLYEQTRLLIPSIASAIYCIAARDATAKERAKEFLRQVYIGDGASGAPLLLRNRLTINMGAKAKIPTGYLFFLTLKAFKSFLNGTSPGTLKWTDGERFPEIP